MKNSQFIENKTTIPELADHIKTMHIRYMNETNKELENLMLSMIDFLAQMIQHRCKEFYIKNNTQQE